MRIYNIIKSTTVEGPGKRFCIWVQGCSKHCKSCFAKETWDFDGGIELSVEEIFAQIKEQKGIEGVTFLGGEPFEQVQELAQLSKLVKSIGLSIVCFTGYTIDELKNKNDKVINKFIGYIDLLIDGGFEIENLDYSRPWVGSSNQRFIYLTDRYNDKEVSKYKNKIEIHLDKNGGFEINGMGNFKELRDNFCLQLTKNNVK